MSPLLSIPVLSFADKSSFLHISPLHCIEVLSFSYIKSSPLLSGIQGFLSYIDENGDAEGNYTVLARKPYYSQHANYSMLPVGQFEIAAGDRFLPVSLKRERERERGREREREREREIKGQ